MASEEPLSTEQMLSDDSVNDSNKRQQVSGTFVPTSTVVAVGVSLVALLGLQVRSLLLSSSQQARNVADPGMAAIPGLLRTHDRINTKTGVNQCRYYMAESAIPGAGLGVFTTTGIEAGDFVGVPDVCIYLADVVPDDEDETSTETSVPRHQLQQLFSHGWNADTFFGQFEGDHSRAACEGLPSLMNSMPEMVFNTEVVSMRDPTNGGLDRHVSPGAGAITHYFGTTARAVDTIRAGSELTTDYTGNFGYDESRVGQYKKPSRSVDWIRENGLCIDNIEIGPATDPAMGRGAFALRSFAKNDLVAPAPLQIYANRSHFARNHPEEVFVNYLFQVEDDDNDLLFFPYGPGVNLINHDRHHPNVGLRWSTSSLHRSAWLHLKPDQLLDISYAGGLILEVYALRRIDEGEELYLDYGSEWDQAWSEHVQEWQPHPRGDRPYVYPADMDETDVLRTVTEQENDPYPENLAMACSTPLGAQDRGGENRTITWMEPWLWIESFVHCNVLEREEAENGDMVYTVSISFDDTTVDSDLQVPMEQRIIDRQVPRRAIRFVDRPYTSDQHLKTAFRHPMALPDNLVPQQWRRHDSSVSK